MSKGPHSHKRRSKNNRRKKPASISPTKPTTLNKESGDIFTGLEVKRQAKLTLERIKEDIWICGASITDTIHVGGLESIGSMKTSVTPRQIVNGVCKSLREKPRAWTVATFVFHDVPGKPEHYQMAVYEMEDHTTTENDTVTTKYLRQQWADAKEDTRLSTGWISFPTEDFPVEENLDAFLEIFREWGVWDRECCESYVQMKKLEGLTAKEVIDVA